MTIHKIQAIIFTYVVLLLTVSCSINKDVSSKIEKVYSLESNESVELRFNESEFSIVDTHTQEHLPTIDCCDTISYGSWKQIKPHLLSLTSDDFLSSELLPEVKEFKNSQDSITIEIVNPIEKLYQKFNQKNRDIIYEIAANVSGRSLKYLINGQHDSNFITVSKKNDEHIKDFKIYIYPKHSFRGRHVGVRIAETKKYLVKDLEANYFTYVIPELTLEYLTYLRLNEDYIFKIGKNRLKYNGDIYNRKRE